ncbi:hypothetical protein P9112_000337 [Eukaryota sp. TZLM1-RC]
MDPCQTFTDLLAKGQHLFASLSEMPQFSGDAFINRCSACLETYYTLWKLQQSERQALDNNNLLPRSVIGDIASRLAQLFYHRYVRTTDPRHLLHAYTFFAAIHSQKYYSNIPKDPTTITRVFRYYTRFIAVCLLRCTEKQIVMDLTATLTSLISTYSSVLSPCTLVEWNSLLHEINHFIDSLFPPNLDSSARLFDNRITSHWVTNSLPYSTIASRRPSLSYCLSPLSNNYITDSPQQPTPVMTHSFPKLSEQSKRHGRGLKMGEVVVVGNKSQARFSELTVDMLRVMTCVERSDYGMTIDDHVIDFDSFRSTMSTPRHLLYKPSVGSLLSGISNVTSTLSTSRYLLVYLSADGLDAEKGSINQPMGLKMTCENNPRAERFNSQCLPLDGLYPFDLFSFTRNHLFLVIDSPNAFLFQTLEPKFDSMLMLLLSPKVVHPLLEPLNVQDSVFTLFITSPALAYLRVFDENGEGIDNNCLHSIDCCISSALGDVSKNMCQYCDPDDVLVSFFDDEILRILVLRAILFRQLIVKLNKGVVADEYLPIIKPSVPQRIFELNLWDELFDELSLFLNQNQFDCNQFDCELQFDGIDDL